MTQAISTIIVKDEYLCVTKSLKCDDPNNKKGFTWRGLIRGPHWIRVSNIKEFGGVLCAVVRVHHHMGCNYYGAEKIVPLSEFEKQGERKYKYSQDADWYVWPDQTPRAPETKW